MHLLPYKVVQNRVFNTQEPIFENCVSKILIKSRDSYLKKNCRPKILKNILYVDPIRPKTRRHCVVRSQKRTFLIKKLDHLH